VKGGHGYGLPRLRGRNRAATSLDKDLAVGRDRLSDIHSVADLQWLTICSRDVGLIPWGNEQRQTASKA
jgi:hypothetical protein